MPGARDIALIILCLEALIAGIVPLILLAGLAYGVYWLRGKIVLGLQKAFEYAELARLKVETAMAAITNPFIRAYATVEMVRNIFVNSCFSIMIFIKSLQHKMDF